MQDHVDVEGPDIGHVMKSRNAVAYQVKPGGLLLSC
jgi:hypothetical protein